MQHWVDLGLKTRVQSPTRVKHKAYPVEMRVPVDLKIFQNATVELPDVLHAGFTHEDGCFFAAYAARAKTHHGFAFQMLAVVQQRLGELGKFDDTLLHRVFEGA